MLIGGLFFTFMKLSKQRFTIARNHVIDVVYMNIDDEINILKMKEMYIFDK